MSQHDYVLNNSNGATFRADLNGALTAIVSQNSGATAPTAPYAYMLWTDTSTSPATLRMRDGSNAAWINVGKAVANFGLQPAGNYVYFDATTGAATLPAGSNAQRPAVPVSGQLRFNTASLQFEGYNGVLWSGIGGAGNAILNTFNGTGAQTVFTLSADPGSANSTTVVIGGTVQMKSTYTVSGTTLTFSGAPPAGTGNIEVTYYGTLTIGTPADASVTTPKLASSSVTSVKLSADLQASTFGFKNRIINGLGLINQRAVSGTVTLAAGVYGHDRFKAGASGCTYTFATSGNVTTFTITAGSLIQVVEGLNLETGTYCLSWTGTSQGKIGAGSYAASGVTGAIEGGTNTNVELKTGTFSLPQLEKGSTATAFDYRDYGREFIMCQRYYVKQGNSGAQYFQIGIFVWDGPANCSFNYQLPVTMRSIPTFSKSGSFSSSHGTPNIAGMVIDVSATTTKVVGLQCAAGSGGTMGYSSYIRANNDLTAYIDFSAEL